LDTLGEIRRSDQRHTNTKVNIHSVLELLGGTLDDTFPTDSSVTRASLEHLSRVLGKGSLLNHGLLSALNDLVDIDTLQVDIFRIDFTNVDNVFRFNNGKFGVLRH